MNNKEKLEKILEAYLCPLCGSDLYISWATCIDPMCCGGVDSVMCEKWACDGDIIDFYFDAHDEDEFRKILCRFPMKN